MLKKEGEGEGVSFEGDFYPTKTLFLWGPRFRPFKLPWIIDLIINTYYLRREL